MSFCTIYIVPLRGVLGSNVLVILRVTVMPSFVPLLTKISQLEQKQTNCDNLISHFYLEAFF